MSVSIELRRRVDLERWQVVGDFATFENRPEVQVLLQRAKVAGRLDPEVVELVLPGLGSGGAKGLTDHLRRLALLDEHGALTGAGVRAAKDGLVPIPETGLYELLVAKDPVFETRIFAVSRIEAGTEGPRGGLVPAPSTLPTNEPFRSWVKDETWMLRRLVAAQGEAPKGMRVDTQAMQLTVRISPGPPATCDWTPGGHFSTPSAQGDIPIPVRPEPVPSPDAWELLDHWTRANPEIGQWDAQARALRVPFDPRRLDVRARNEFRMTLSLKDVDVRGLGRFDDCTVANVALAPRDPDAAQAWATALLIERIRSEATGHLSRQELHQVFYELVVDTPLEEFLPSLPSHEELLCAVSKEPATIWRLRAAVDLYPTGVPREWLERVPLKEAPKAKQPSSSVALTILPKEMRSMAEVVQALNLADAKKCMIYDKHLSAQKLPVLRALVEALRSANDKLKLGVVTQVTQDDAGRALKKDIGQLVGSEPVDIRSLGGGALLHGRYILFGEGASDPSTIHATHSLVHARPPPGTRSEAVGPQTPLIWNDVNFMVQPVPPEPLRLAWEKLS